MISSIGFHSFREIASPVNLLAVSDVTVGTVALNGSIDDLFALNFMADGDPRRTLRMKLGFEVHTNEV